MLPNRQFYSPDIFGINWKWRPERKLRVLLEAHPLSSAARRFPLATLRLGLVRFSVLRLPLCHFHIPACSGTSVRRGCTSVGKCRGQSEGFSGALSLSSVRRRRR